MSEMSWIEYRERVVTAMMLYLFPDRVDMGRVPPDPPAAPPPYDLYPTDTSWIPPSGVLSPAKTATAEIGRILVDEFVDLVVPSLDAAFPRLGVRPSRRPT